MCCHKLVTDASKILQMTFDEVQHGPGNDYTYHHKIKKFFFQKIIFRIEPLKMRFS